MARVYPLFSSSKGNSTFIGNPKGGILIDVGVSYRRLNEGLRRCGLENAVIHGIFITHEHSDHVQGLSVLTKRHNIPVYGESITLKNIQNKGLINSTATEINGMLEIGDMEVCPFDTPHDTAGSCGYRIHTDDGKMCGICTDLGHITPIVAENLSLCDMVLIESNYDSNMLKNGSYPYYLKERIASKSGHLSNFDCSEQVLKLVSKRTTRIVLGHLSQENNSPDVAEKTVLNKLSGFKRNSDYILEIAPVETTGKFVTF